MDPIELATSNDFACLSSIIKWCKFHNVLLSTCGRGSYTEKTGRDTTKNLKVISKSGRPYYIYFNAAYIPYKGGKVSAFSSISLYDFISDCLIHKTHISKPEDIKDFYSHIETVILDK